MGWVTQRLMNGWTRCSIQVMFDSGNVVIVQNFVQHSGLWHEEVSPETMYRCMCFNPLPARMTSYDLLIGFIWHYAPLFSRLTVPCCSDTEWVTVAIYTYSLFWIFTKVVYLQRCLAVTWLVPHETAATSMNALCAPWAGLLSAWWMAERGAAFRWCLTVAMSS